MTHKHATLNFLKVGDNFTSNTATIQKNSFKNINKCMAFEVSLRFAERTSKKKS